MTATPAPDGSAPEVQYGPDAQRLPVWLAAGCDTATRRLAARALPLIEPTERARALRLRPTGDILDPREGALPLVAVAAAAAAAGRADQRDLLLDRAQETAAAYPGYYQDAWVPLGRALLTTTLLDACRG